MNEVNGILVKPFYGPLGFFNYSIRKIKLQILMMGRFDQGLKSD